MSESADRYSVFLTQLVLKKKDKLFSGILKSKLTPKPYFFIELF